MNLSKKTQAIKMNAFSMTNEAVKNQTISDFGDQWTRYTANEGYYASASLLADLLFPFIKTEDLKGKRVADIGSGTGRIVNMILASGAAHVVAVEPSRAFEVLMRNVSDPARVSVVNVSGESLPLQPPYDFIISLGVIHHIPDPLPVVKRCHEALKPGGRCLFWLYGHEGNGLYLVLARPMRAVTRLLPHFLLSFLAWILTLPLSGYIALCRVLPLPMKAYMTEHLAKLSLAQRHLTVYDQLNPAYAKYYRRAEAIEMLEEAGFKDVQAHHRHGYSWTVVGTKGES